MACWVVPAVAAEFWGVSVEQVLGRVEDGSARAKSEHGFMFVDVAPHAEEFRPAPPAPPAPPRERPRTYTPATRRPVTPSVVVQPAYTTTAPPPGASEPDAASAWNDARVSTSRARRRPVPAGML